MNNHLQKREVQVKSIKPVPTTLINNNKTPAIKNQTNKIQSAPTKQILVKNKPSNRMFSNENPNDKSSNLDDYTINLTNNIDQNDNSTSININNYYKPSDRNDEKHYRNNTKVNSYLKTNFNEQNIKPDKNTLSRMSKQHTYQEEESDFISEIPNNERTSLMISKYEEDFNLNYNNLNEPEITLLEKNKLISNQKEHNVDINDKEIIGDYYENKLSNINDNEIINNKEINRMIQNTHNKPIKTDLTNSLNKKNNIIIHKPYIETNSNNDYDTRLKALNKELKSKETKVSNVKNNENNENNEYANENSVASNNVKSRQISINNSIINKSNITQSNKNKIPASYNQVNTNLSKHTVKSRINNPIINKSVLSKNKSLSKINSSNTNIDTRKPKNLNNNKFSNNDYDPEALIDYSKYSDKFKLYYKNLKTNLCLLDFPFIHSKIQSSDRMNISVFDHTNASFMYQIIYFLLTSFKIPTKKEKSFNAIKDAYSSNTNDSNVNYLKKRSNVNYDNSDSEEDIDNNENLNKKNNNNTSNNQFNQSSLNPNTTYNELEINSEENLKMAFQFCYPVTTLTESKNFKEVSYSVVKALEIKGLLDENTLIGKSILDQASGEKLIKFLYQLSVKVIESRLNFNNVSFINNKQINNNKRIIGTSKQNSILENQLSILKDNLIEYSEKIQSLQYNSKEFYKKISEEREELLKENKVVENKIKTILKRGLLKNDSEINAINRMVQLENYNIFFDNIREIDGKFKAKNYLSNNNEHKEDELRKKNEDSSNENIDNNSTLQASSSNKGNNNENQFISFSEKIKELNDKTYEMNKEKNSQMLKQLILKHNYILFNNNEDNSDLSSNIRKIGNIRINKAKESSSTNKNNSICFLHEIVYQLGRKIKQITFNANLDKENNKISGLKNLTNQTLNKLKELSD